MEAEKLAAGNDWRGGVNRFRELLDEWKALPRLDRATDDELWHRFSSARTTYTRRRKSQFAKESEQRETARTTKEKLVAEAEALAELDGLGADHRRVPGPDDPVEGGRLRPARGRRRRCGGGSARRRTSSSGPSRPPRREQDSEFRANARGQGARWSRGRGGYFPSATRPRPAPPTATVLDRWAAIGKVPRELIRPLDSRLRAVESRHQAGRGAIAGAGPTRRPGPAPRTPRPSWRPRSPPWRRRPPRRRPAATAPPPGEATAVGGDLPGVAGPGPPGRQRLRRLTREPLPAVGPPKRRSNAVPPCHPEFSAAVDGGDDRDGTLFVVSRRATTRSE